MLLGLISSTRRLRGLFESLAPPVPAPDGGGGDDLRLYTLLGLLSVGRRVEAFLAAAAPYLPERPCEQAPVLPAPYRSILR